MCPGGFIVPAATAPGEVVVNGMSLRRRDSPFANSGLVVSVEPRDWEAIGLVGALGGIELQRRIERAAFEAGGGALRAPATRATDFVRGRASSSVPESSYIPGIVASDVAAVLDHSGLDLSGRLRRALDSFDRTMRGYLTDEAVLVGVESRTSSPVRVPRHPETLESLDVLGLYPSVAPTQVFRSGRPTVTALQHLATGLSRTRVHEKARTGRDGGRRAVARGLRCKRRQKEPETPCA
jgi:uncharacterized FAD-dependent dehydrogenase